MNSPQLQDSMDLKTGTMTPAVVAPAGADAPPARNGALQLLNLVLRHRVLVIGLAFVLALVAGLLAISRPRQYRSTASFTPQQSSSTPSGVASIAASFGISVSGASQSESPQFYADLLRSDEILRRVAAATYHVQGPAGQMRGNLPTLLKMEGAGERQMFDALKMLREVIDVSTNIRTSVVDVSVKTRYPELSRQLLDSLLASVNEFNLASRQSRASSERQFVEGRLNQYRNDLQEAEGEYEAFLRTNRTIDAPRLMIQRDRFQRRIGMLQQVVTSLTSAFEQARIDEVRSTPAIRPIEHPRTPVVAEPRGTMKKALLAGGIGAFLGLVIALLIERMQFARAGGDPDFNELIANGRSLIPRWLRARS